jgi:hypothetical protein
MLIVLALFAALSAADGCASPEVLPNLPVVPLLPGSYALVVNDAELLGCDGVSVDELVGTALPAEVRVGDDGRAALLLAGWAPVGGEHGDGWILVEGPLRAREAGPAADGEAGAQPDLDEAREAACIDIPAEDEEVEEPRPETPWVGLELRAYGPEEARGGLLLVLPGCEADLHVTMGPAGDLEEVVDPPVGADDAPIAVPR